MELLLKTALDDIVEPTFSAFSESDFAELALEVWLCRTPTWSDDAISKVLKALDIPSILLEMGYLSNIQDETLLNTIKFQQKLGLAILIGLDRYFFEGQSFKH